jgi:hypothetical protein
MARQFSRHAKFGVTQTPLLAGTVSLLACEIDGHRSPKANDVIKGESAALDSVDFVESFLSHDVSYDAM